MSAGFRFPETVQGPVPWVDKMASPKLEPIFPPRGDLSGTTIGRYAVRRRIGAGGMGEVYLAEDTTLKRPVALKRVNPKLRGDWSQVQRLVKEAERVSSLNHASIASIFDILQDKGEVLLVMEYIEGSSLRARLQTGALAVEQVIELAVCCAEALQAAHEKAIIHGDIKPENMMLTPAGSLKLLDFGVARRIATEEETVDDVSRMVDKQVGGTPAYMAPEVLMDKSPDARSDLFSLGVVLYEMLSGHHPFPGESFAARYEKILYQSPDPLRTQNPEVPKWLEHVVLRLLEKHPERRYQSATDLLEDLHDLRDGRSLWWKNLRRVAVRHWSRSDATWRLAAIVLLAVGIGTSVLYRAKFSAPANAPTVSMVQVPVSDVVQASRSELSALTA